MARVRMNLKTTNNAKQVATAINRSIQDAIVDVTLDLKRVSSASAPMDEGFLQKNTHAFNFTNDVAEGYVGFQAVENGFDYATWTHDEDYNLGEQSQAKKGGSSVFGSGTVPVGKGYLGNAVSKFEKGYLDYIQKAVKEATK